MKQRKKLITNYERLLGESLKNLWKTKLVENKKFVVRIYPQIYSLRVISRDIGNLFYISHTDRFHIIPFDHFILDSPAQYKKHIVGFPPPSFTITPSGRVNTELY